MAHHLRSKTVSKIGGVVLQNEFDLVVLIVFQI